jgi:hypothetical protein
MCNPFIRSTPQNYTHKKGLHHVKKHYFTFSGVD